MANVNAPFGLRPIRHKNGEAYCGQANLYHMPASYATDVFVGDPVIVNGTSAPDGTPDVVLATAGATNKITGVVVGFVKRIREDVNYGKASTERWVLVCDDPSVIYEIVADTTAAVAVGDVSTNINFAAGGGGSTVYGTSSWVAATTSMTSNATYQGTIERVVNRPDNAIDGTTACHLEVSINLHQKMSYAIAGI
jgi:hypothetical protein